MAHVTGSMDTTTLPSTVRAVPDSQMCDDCGEKLATRRLQGETDSFGAEWADLCDECFASERVRRRENSGGQCDYCKEHSHNLIWTRDIDEGMHGPVYHVCKRCYDRQQEAIRAELERYGYYEDWY
ncbi:hypothetical protein COT97_05680 [Candidatus Falkowbacteria bacterium CG10_big_fil_rev_8_21_14_0_10_39_11]|uniref:Uncharacterized protein n=1 Tax=Candidatus Falkowbacteria bacterium CG10_big_fil_rev_8_21_14_0_10_39_11 TaxID=1974565 RepID=A0A2H0V3F4_9BACT|nr:MAG: hypothetical protein COT97_05680 [Candidatus Falkowbacteria bacterium CG10_big_fil_rev_8_21_14_0_10_39_11]